MQSLVAETGLGCQVAWVQILILLLISSER